MKKAKNKTTKYTPPRFLHYPLVLIVLLGIVSYSNTLRGPFVFDDIPQIVNNEEIRHISRLSGLWQTVQQNGRPLASVSFALNYYFGGLAPFGYHLVNLVIHLLSALLVYIFIKLTLRLPRLEESYGKYAQDIALVSGLLFVAHPIQTQAVSYIVQRMTSLAALFFLLTLYCYGMARQASGKKKPIYFLCCALAAICALGSKQSSITLPFFIILYEYYFFLRPQTDRRKWLYITITLVLSTALIGMVYTGFHPLGWLSAEYLRRPFTPGGRMLTQLRVVIFYLSLLLVPLPSRLNLMHHFNLSHSLTSPNTTLVCLILILGLVAAGIFLARKRPLVSFAIIWFWGNLLLESSLLPLEMVFEHRLYLPSVGIFLLTAIFLIKGLGKLRSGARPGLWAGLFMGIILCGLTYQRNKVWQDSLSLWKDTARKSPNEPRVLYNLGNTYQEYGQFKYATAIYQRAIKLKPGLIGLHNNLGYTYLQQGKPLNAIAQFEKEIKLHPGYAPAYFNLGNAYQDKGEMIGALVQYKRTIEIDPQYKGARNNMGNIYLLQDKLDKAAAECSDEIKYHPDNAEAHFTLGKIYRKQGVADKAARSFKRALEIDGLFKDAHNSLGNIYMQQGKTAQAASRYVEEIKHHPQNAHAYYNLGNAYRILLRTEDAISQYKRALDIDPSVEGPHNNLGSIYMRQGKYEQAIAEYSLELGINPRNAGTHYNLGRIYLKTANKAKAIFHLNQSLTLTPNQPQAEAIRRIIKKQEAKQSD